MENVKPGSNRTSVNNQFFESFFVLRHFVNWHFEARAKSAVLIGGFLGSVLRIREPRSVFVPPLKLRRPPARHPIRPQRFLQVECKFIRISFEWRSNTIIIETPIIEINRNIHDRCFPKGLLEIFSSNTNTYSRAQSRRCPLFLFPGSRPVYLEFIKALIHGGLDNALNDAVHEMRKGHRLLYEGFWGRKRFVECLVDGAEGGWSESPKTRFVIVRIF